MKIKAWDEGSMVEPTMYVAIRTEGKGVVVFLVNESGESILEGDLLRLRAGETIQRVCSVSPRFGFPLNVDGQIKIEGLSNG